MGLTGAVSGRDICTDALIDINAFGPNIQISADAINVCMRILNRMLDQWKTQELTMYCSQGQTFNLTQNQQDYTIGIGGDFNTARPLFIDYASAIINSDQNQPLELPFSPNRMMTDQEWQDVPVKNVQSSFPTQAYYNFGFDQVHGWGLISVFPIPSVTNAQIRLYIRQAIDVFTSPAQTFMFPPGYQDAITRQLEMRLFRPFGVNPDATLIDLAKKALGWVKKSNSRGDVLRLDPMLVRQKIPYNWLSDQGGSGGGSV